jgi:hypothetical protein
MARNFVCGTIYSYTMGGCRCENCKAAIREYRARPEVKKKSDAARNKWVKENPKQAKESRDKASKKSKQKRYDYVNKLKDNPCTDCGQRYNHWQMDFDHLKSETKYKSISLLCAHKESFKKIDEEIAKCELVCANCHRDRTYRRQNGLL